MIHISNGLKAAVLGAALVLGTGTAGFAASGGEHFHFERQDWSFSGVFGTYDRAQLRRGYKVYAEVCAACHSMRLLYYRNLTEKGGPELPEAKVKAIAAEAEVRSGPNEEGEELNADGEFLTRPSVLADHIKSPYPNRQAAMAANGGAYPPDMSVLAKSRAPHADHAGFIGFFTWTWNIVRDVLTQYQEGGPDYIYALMTSYKETPPEGVKVPDGKYYNAAFPGHIISMAPPLSEEAVEYEDGTKPTLENHARDVAAFLMWAAEPHLNERKRRGFMVLVYMAILTGLLYMVKRSLWRNEKH